MSSPPTLRGIIYQNMHHMLFLLLFKTDDFMHAVKNKRGHCHSSFPWPAAFHFRHLQLVLDQYQNQTCLFVVGVFFCPKDYKIHFWLEETPTQLLNRLDFSKIINAPTSIFLFLFSAIFIYRTHTLDKYTFSALYGKYIADVLFLFIIGLKGLVS